MLRFVNARNSLQIIAHRKEDGDVEKMQVNGNDSTENGEKPLNKLCFLHADCCAEKYLELRIGDAALRDQITVYYLKLN